MQNPSSSRSLEGGWVSSAQGMVALRRLLLEYLHLLESRISKKDIYLRVDVVIDLACELGLQFGRDVLM